MPSREEDHTLDDFCHFCREPSATCRHSRLLPPDPNCPDCLGSGRVVVQEIDIGVGFQAAYGMCECVWPPEDDPS